MEGVQRTPGLELEHSSKAYIRFLPEDWVVFPQLLKGEGWVPSNRLLLFQFTNARDYLRLHLVLGPGDDATRKEIFDLTSQHGQVFKRGTGKFTTKWTSLYRKDFLNAGDYGEMDMESIKSKFDTQMESFVADDLPSIRHHLNELFGET